MANLKEISKKEDILCAGHRLCAGCAAPIALRQAFMAAKTPVVIGCATGCTEVATTIYPYTSWNTSFIHNAFENSAATVSGVETAYRALKKKGKISEEMKFIAMGGDGGTYDIGLQSLSGAMERGHNMVYICYDNEAYMNTGIQRSSATPLGASTTTQPAGKVVQGKTVYHKDLTGILAAHKIPYVAQASPHNWHDLIRKMEYALEVEGPAFLNIIAPCPRGWRTKEADSIEMAKLAVETCFWPLYEVFDGRKWKVNYKPPEKLPLTDWTGRQGRFKHLSKPENKGIIEDAQARLDQEWEDLLRKEEMTKDID